MVVQMTVFRVRWRLLISAFVVLESASHIQAVDNSCTQEKISSIENTAAFFHWRPSIGSRKIWWSRLYFGESVIATKTVFDPQNEKVNNYYTKRYKLVRHSNNDIQFLLNAVTQKDAGIYERYIITNTGDTHCHKWNLTVCSFSHVSACEEADARFKWEYSSSITHIKWSKIYFKTQQKVHITKNGHIKPTNIKDLDRYELVYRTKLGTEFHLKNVSQQDSGIHKHEIVTEEGDIYVKEWHLHVKKTQTKITASTELDREGCYTLKCGDQREHVWFYEDNTPLGDARICDDDVTVWCRRKHGCTRSYPLYLPPADPERVKESSSTSLYVEVPKTLTKYVNQTVHFKLRFNDTGQSIRITRLYRNNVLIATRSLKKEYVDDKYTSRYQFNNIRNTEVEFVLQGLDINDTGQYEGQITKSDGDRTTKKWNLNVKAAFHPTDTIKNSSTSTPVAENADSLPVSGTVATSVVLPILMMIAVVVIAVVELYRYERKTGHQPSTLLVETRSFSPYCCQRKNENRTDVCYSQPNKETDSESNNSLMLACEVTDFASPQDATPVPVST